MLQLEEEGCPWREMDGVGGWVRGWAGDVQATEPDSVKERVTCWLWGPARCETSWSLHGDRPGKEAWPNTTKREGTEILILYLQENCPSVVLLEMELTPEISGKIHMGTSEEAISADPIQGI